MKSVAELKINHQTTPIVDYQLMLELNTPGRGFITAITEAECIGKLIEINLGYNDSVYRYFTGFVERAAPAEKGAQRLFIRELAGVFERSFPCSLQHPTAQDVINYFSEQTGMKFALPATNYINTQIPYFQHSGTGIQLINNIGRSFSIDDYVWFQYPDGTVYAGAYVDSRYAKTELDVPEEFSTRSEGGNTLSFPVIAAIRPGMKVNGKRVTKIAINNDEMSLTWTPLDKNGQPAQKSPEQRQIERLFPELANKLHVPRMARVTAPTDTAALGDVSDPFRPRYAVNVQLLDENGNPASDTPEYAAVPLPVTMASNEGGIFQFPAPGSLVEIGFADGRPDKPIIRQTLQDGLSMPDIKPGEQLQQQRAGVSNRVTTDGSWHKETDQEIKDTSAKRTITSDSEQRTTSERTATVKGNDNLIVLGSFTLMAGAVIQVAEGDFSQVTSANFTSKVANNRIDDIGQNHTTTIGGKSESTIAGTLEEKITGIRTSIAAAHQLQGGSFHIGNADTNLLTLMTDILDTIDSLAKFTAQHSHSNTGTPLNAESINGVSTKTKELTTKYRPLIK